MFRISLLISLFSTSPLIIVAMSSESILLFYYKASALFRQFLYIYNKCFTNVIAVVINMIFLLQRKQYNGVPEVKHCTLHLLRISYSIKPILLVNTTLYVKISRQHCLSCPRNSNDLQRKYSNHTTTVTAILKLLSTATSRRGKTTYSSGTAVKYNQI